MMSPSGGGRDEGALSGCVLKYFTQMPNNCEEGSISDKHDADAGHDACLIFFFGGVGLGKQGWVNEEQSKAKPTSKRIAEYKSIERMKKYPKNKSTLVARARGAVVPYRFDGSPPLQIMNAARRAWTRSTGCRGSDACQQPNLQCAVPTATG